MIEKISEDTSGLASTAQFRILIEKVNEIIEVVNSRETFVEKYAEIGFKMQACPRCNGKGFIGYSMSFETVCNYCTGTGVLRI